MAARLSGAGGGARGLPRQNADINVTPFVDVMLVLLIIFMVAAPLATTSVKLDLPPPTLDGRREEPVLVSVHESGAVYIGAQRTQLSTLAGDLARSIGGPSPTAEQIYIRADGGVPYGGFMGVMSALHDGGFYKLGLVGEDLPSSL